jgi:hypothetical protein
MTTLVATTWEIEVEETYVDFETDRDEARFRSRMELLGFDDDEIDEHLAVMPRDTAATDNDSRTTGAT